MHVEDEDVENVGMEDEDVENVGMEDKDVENVGMKDKDVEYKEEDVERTWERTRRRT